MTEEGGTMHKRTVVKRPWYYIYSRTFVEAVAEPLAVLRLSKNILDLTVRIKKVTTLEVKWDAR